jgi:hypothetical protein
MPLMGADSSIEEIRLRDLQRGFGLIESSQYGGILQVRVIVFFLSNQPLAVQLRIVFQHLSGELRIVGRFSDICFSLFYLGDNERCIDLGEGIAFFDSRVKININFLKNT